MRYKIGDFSKRTNITPRALRHYESLGILSPTVGSENGYRYYSDSDLEMVERIRSFKDLGFSLNEIKELVKLEFEVDYNSILSSLNAQLLTLQNDRNFIDQRINSVSNLLSALNKIKMSKPLDQSERRMVMEKIREDVLTQLKIKRKISPKHLEFIERETKVISDEVKRDFLMAIIDCIDYAKRNQLMIGPGRGNALGSIYLYALGYSKTDPTEEDLYPELFISRDVPEIWFDIQYKDGGKFINYCKKVSTSLSVGEIEAFKFPILDIISDTQKRIGEKIDFDLIDNNSNDVMKPFVAGDVERVFLFDAPPNAIIYRGVDQIAFDWLGFNKVNEYLRRQKIFGFRDIMNIASLVHRGHDQVEERVEEYRLRKSRKQTYNFLSSKMRKKLEVNFGMILYSEEIVEILMDLLGWDAVKAKEFYGQLRNGNESLKDIQKLKSKNPEVYDLLKKEAKYAFNKSHLWGEMHFAKQTAYLKTRYKKEYYAAIDAWEEENKLSWSEIGYKANGITLMQN